MHHNALDVEDQVEGAKKAATEKERSPWRTGEILIRQIKQQTRSDTQTRLKGTGRIF
jgi:hypothetical protein